MLYYLLLGIGLSMDAFSLAIAYGTNNIEKNKIVIISLIVGLLHFIMPNIGMSLRNFIIFDISKYTHIVIAIIFLILAIEMIVSLNDEEDTSPINSFFDILLFAIAVSLDSLMVGIALSLENRNLITAGIVFLIVSSFFTTSGLFLGNFFNQKAGKFSKIVGIVILVAISVKYILD